MPEIKVVDVSTLPVESKKFKDMSLPFFDKSKKVYGVMDLNAYQAHIVSVVGNKTKEDAGLALKFVGFTDEVNINTSIVSKNPIAEVYFSNAKKMFVFKDGNTFYLQHETLSATYNGRGTVRQDKIFLNDVVLYSYDKVQGGIMRISDVEIVQDLGNSTSALMSQDIVTRKFAEKVDKTTYQSDKELANAVFATKNELSNELQTKQEKLVSGNNIKTINGESLLGYTDIKVATPKEIVVTQNLIKEVAETKANKSYVDEVEQTKADKILVDELATDKLDKNDAVGKHYTAGVVKLGEVFNYDGNEAKGSKSHAENGGYGDIFVTGKNVPSPLRRSIIGNNTPLKVMSCKVYIPTQSSSRENIDVIIRVMNASSKAIRESWSRPSGTYDILNINVSRMGEAIYQPLNTNLNTYEEGDYLVFDYGYLGENEYARQQALQFYNALMNVWVENEIISFEFINFADYVSNEASGECSHAEGVGTITNNLAEHAEGKYNNSSPNTISSVGIGENNGYRKNAVEVMKDGKAYFLDLGGYNGRINPSSKSVQEVINGLLTTIKTMEDRITALEAKK